MTHSCQICDNCPMDQPSGSEWQEIHITLDRETSDLDQLIFSSLCHLYGGKVVTINFQTDRGEETQVMSSIPLRISRSEAKDRAFAMVKTLSDMRMKVERVKLECSLHDQDAEFRDGYFEGHVVIDVSSLTSMELMELRSFVTFMDARMSRNEFKPGVMMVTLRKHEVTRLEFLEYMSYLTDMIKRWRKPNLVIKVINEFCYFDSNYELDKEWK